MLDFGVSKSIADSGVSRLALTKSATLIGSPIYMSPEQLESSKDVDARTDIWALGAILYELLSGRTPFDAESMPQLVAAVLHTEPSKFSQLGVDLPPGLEAVVLRALAKNRDQRYASVAEFTQALAPYAPEHAAVSVNRIARVLGPSTRERSGVSPVAAPETVAQRSLPRSPPTPQPVERISKAAAPPSARRWLWAVLALAPLIVGVGMLLSQRGDDGKRELVPDPPLEPTEHMEATGIVPAAPTAGAQILAAAVPDAGQAAEAEPSAEPAAEPDTASPAAAAGAIPTGVDLPRATPEPARDAPASKRPESTRTRRPATPPPTNISDFGGRR